MTTEPVVHPKAKLIQVVIPWCCAGGALLFYLFTLSHWVTFGSIADVSRVSKWEWQPQIFCPLYWLVTLPFTVLPARLVPLALNVFSAVCGAATLGLLARSVALLPQDRTQGQRDREKGAFGLLTIPSAWLPPLLAVFTCGLQLTFWECSTSSDGGIVPNASAEIFDLLLFAYIVRALLEYRIDEQDSWLKRAAFIYGLAITNNWAMIGFFPLFVVALIWMKGFGFFKRQFLGPMLLLGLAGLLLYLLLPLAQSLTHGDQVTFWQALKGNVGFQRSIVATLFKNYRGLIALLALTSILPIFLISIRWPASFGDNSPLGEATGSFIFHFMTLVFLVVCVWIAMDPQASPRNQGLGIPFLTFYYLGAIVAGYGAGYLLLWASRKPDSERRTPPLVRTAKRLVALGVFLLFLGTPIMLVMRNLPQVRLTNGPLLQQIAALQVAAMPGNNVYVFSDDSRRLLLAHSEAVKEGRENDFVFLDSTAMKDPAYHRFLRARYGNRWPLDLPAGRTNHLQDGDLYALMQTLAASNSVYYLHPSFGYYFEACYAQPHGLAFRMLPYPDGVILPPPLSKELLEENNAFWAKAEENFLAPILASVSPPPQRNPGFWKELMERLHISTKPNRDATQMALLLSVNLDYWGTEAQKANQLPNAAHDFQLARSLNGDNVAAQVNYDCNQDLQAGRTPVLQNKQEVKETFDRYRSQWEPILARNGPFDEPTFCSIQGYLFTQGGNYKQAAQQLERWRELAPDNLGPRIALTHLYLGRLHSPESAVKIVRDIREHPGRLALTITNEPQVLGLEAVTYMTLGDTNRLNRAIDDSLNRYPGSTNIVDAGLEIYTRFGLFSNALNLVDRELTVMPTNLVYKLYKGYYDLQLGAYDAAIKPLTEVLSQETNETNFVRNSALLDRAIAYYRSGKLEQSAGDYEAVRKVYPKAYQVYYGLEEIAFQKKDTNAAIQYCESYLTYAPTNSEEAKVIIQRLKDLKKPGSG